MNPQPVNFLNRMGVVKVKNIFTLTIGILVIIFVGLSLSYSEEKKEVSDKGLSSSQIPVDSDKYIIGPEDVLSILVWKEEALSQTAVVVRTDGKISLPLIDEIQAAGYTPMQLKEMLTEKFKQFVESPIVTVMVREAKSFKVYIGGQVKTPGVYTLVKEITILQIIPLAGGFTDWANQRKILLIRTEGGQEKRFTINYKKIISGQDPINNMVLKPGDTIIVPD
jgi:polysaccharide biosynthesis/export protein